MAAESQAVFNKYVEVINLYERAQLKGQKAKASDAQGGLKHIKLHNFRPLGVKDLVEV